MVISFNDKDSEYIDWLYGHDGSFVLNVNTLGKGRSMLHTSRCTHLWEPWPSRKHTVAYPKACADRADELVIWAAEHGHTVKECPTCKPLG